MAIDWLNILKNVAPILGGAASNRALGQQIENQNQNAQTNSATSRYQALVNANRLQNIEQPSANLSQVGAGSLMSTWKPVSITPASVPYGSHTNGAVMPTIAGGPTVTDAMRQTGASVADAAMKRQLGGNQIDTSLFPSNDTLGIGSTGGSSFLDQLLGYGSTAASLLGSFAKPTAAAGVTPTGTGTVTNPNLLRPQFGGEGSGGADWNGVKFGSEDTTYRPTASGEYTPRDRNPVDPITAWANGGSGNGQGAAFTDTLAALRVLYPGLFK